MRYRAAVGLALGACSLNVAFALLSLVLAVLNGRPAGDILIDEGIVGIAILILAFSVVQPAHVSLWMWPTSELGEETAR